MLCNCLNMRWDDCGLTQTGAIATPYTLTMNTETSVCWRLARRSWCSRVVPNTSIRIVRRTLASQAYTEPKDNSHSEVATTPALRPAQRTILEKAIRVDHAGEIAANYIYRGQLAVLGRDREVAPVIQVRRRSRGQYMPANGTR